MQPILPGCIEPRLHDAARGDEDVAGRDRESIEDRERQIVRAEPVAHRYGEEWGLELVHRMVFGTAEWERAIDL